MLCLLSQALTHSHTYTQCESIRAHLPLAEGKPGQWNSWSKWLIRGDTERMAEVRERVQGLAQNTARRSSNIDRSGVAFEARQVGVGAGENRSVRAGNGRGELHRAELARRGRRGPQVEKLSRKASSRIDQPVARTRIALPGSVFHTCPLLFVGLSCSLPLSFISLLSSCFTPPPAATLSIATHSFPARDRSGPAERDLET